ncbi:MAG: hypothetical protein EOP85_01160 [Verrucomicrobiaceae bacterium]|nr:MAG: hypothetical protein EOP85_01160 [Verrucomicrobiaceae bacterium]
MSNLPAVGIDQPSTIDINPEGVRFELWTVSSTPFQSYLLQSTYVSGVVPVGKVVIDTEDPWGKDVTSVSYANPTFATSKQIPKNVSATVRRTRADRPFKVYVETAGLKEEDASAPDYSRKLNFQRHLQSYGANGTGNNLDRSQAILATPAQPQITTNGVQNPLVVSLSSIAGADRRKLRGEETFSVWSLADNSVPSSPIAAQKLSSDYLQIWPMTDGLLSGISMNQVVRFAIPAVTFQYTDTYPGAQTFAQVYKGEVRDNVQGLIVPGSHKNNTSMIPESNLETTGSEFDRMFDSDGRWTIEVLTVSPFDTIRLHYVTFTVDRTIEVNGSVTTIE